MSRQRAEQNGMCFSVAGFLQIGQGLNADLGIGIHKTKAVDYNPYSPLAPLPEGGRTEKLRLSSSCLALVFAGGGVLMGRYNYHKTQSSDYKRARELRKSVSPIERKLWIALRNSTSDGEIKFRRQQPVPPYFADFSCMQARLLIEIDGMSHDNQAEYDRAREEFLVQQGFVVLRFANDEV